MYQYKKEVDMSFQNALERIRDELAKEGFGILSEIDVQATLKKKLDVDFDKYVILGACNPPFAHKVLKIKRDVGLLLPCNVILYELEGKTFVAAINPSSALRVIENGAVSLIAERIERKLRKVIDTL